MGLHVSFFFEYTNFEEAWETSKEWLKTLFNIVEAQLKKNGWTLMSVLYSDVQMARYKQPGTQKFWNLCGHYQDIVWMNITI